MRQWLSHIGARVVLLLFLTVTPAFAVSSGQIDALFDLLQAHGVAPTNRCTDRAVVEAIVRVYDPYAVVVAKDETSPAPASTHAAPLLESVEMWHGDLGYLKLNGIQPQTAAVVRRQFAAWSTSAWCGVIIDLREAGGSGLEAAEELAALLCPTSRVLYTVFDCNNHIVGKRMRPELEPLEPTPPPTVVLINGQTAGASEILAVSLKGQGDVLLAGALTKGDLGIRRWIDFGDNLVIHVATRWAGTAAGEPCRTRGVSPDLVAHTAALPAPTFPSLMELRNPLSVETRRHHELDRRVGQDAILRRAVDFLLGLRALKAPCHIPPVEPVGTDNSDPPVPEVESPDARNPRDAGHSRANPEQPE